MLNCKFLNEEIKDAPEGFASLNITDAPVISFGEDLMNYVEASSELASVGGPALSQQDFDESINVLRACPGIQMFNWLEIYSQLMVLSLSIWIETSRFDLILGEIRRERRVELMMEGFRKMTECGRNLNTVIWQTTMKSTWAPRSINLYINLKTLKKIILLKV